MTYHSPHRISLGGHEAPSETTDRVHVPLPGTSVRDASHVRRLSDKIMAAFHHACDDGQSEIAAHLLDVLESILSRPTYLPSGWERRAKESLVAAHMRLWLLRHPEALER